VLQVCGGRARSVSAGLTPRKLAWRRGDPSGYQAIIQNKAFAVTGSNGACAMLRLEDGAMLCGARMNVLGQGRGPGQQVLQYCPGKVVARFEGV